MKRRTITAVFAAMMITAQAQTDSTAKVPFSGMDLSWINGQNRQQNYPLVLTDKKTGETILTGVAYLDAYYNYNFNNPKDKTHTNSSAIGRHNEFTLNMASLGVETNYKNVIGRLWLQFGQMGSIVQDGDGSVLHGRNTSVSNLKYIREAAAGYHFNKWYGVNVEMGIFMSYIGLESYVLNENWNYQRSLVCDFTPFYFTGARLQVYPSKKFKTELWLLNGWQTYNSWNQGIGVGSSNYYRPSENVQLVANFYYGKDTRNSNRIRFHHDNSIVARYYRNAKNTGISQAAFSLNTHYGFQSGDGVTAKQQYMAGTSLANRIWFNKNKLALTLRGDVLTNPGTYLAFTPSPVVPNDYTDAINADPKQKLNLGQFTTTFDVMPNDHVTFRLEYGYRAANVPYFAGPGGTTSPDGWADTPVGNWRPDLRKDESRVTVAVSFRL
ncbi:outer membrane beta-barrel protein [Sediminibacterium ginsengisoli]|uniref:Putative beta-barrel porin-2, OmpL-like. bbp2 n=1 Tax=Sediminibacterium ginsengisoli TaxID=413434 RepID=A0A1T4KTA6_9BACT|nr:outer membrane beta-barrel protein [Sediminibacterium ginsengisoli]SJZ45568.1 Putative beta-barrel porin-2, OmpL-like. bbp2 [Sediminibacterium ginsengisoli]